MTSTEKVSLPIPAWISATMDQPALFEVAESPISENRVILPVNFPPAIWDSFVHRIPEDARHEIIPAQVTLIWEKTLAINSGGLRLCKFIGLGIAHIRRVIVPLDDFKPGEDPEAPKVAPGPTGIVTG